MKQPKNKGKNRDGKRVNETNNDDTETQKTNRPCQSEKNDKYLALIQKFKQKEQYSKIETC